MVELLVANEKVAGSNLVSRSKVLKVVFWTAFFVFWGTYFWAPVLYVNITGGFTPPSATRALISVPFHGALFFA